MSTTHGLYNSPTYRSWKSARERCYQPGHKSYVRYGGRGITMCERWRQDFPAFFADMGERPEGSSLERIDNSGNYEPSNCRWATAKEQANNRRDNALLTFRGKTQNIKQWATELGLNYNTLFNRLDRMTTEDALTRKVITRISPDTAAAILADYASGIGSYRLAKKYGRSTTAIKDLIRAGVTHADCA